MNNVLEEKKWMKYIPWTIFAVLLVAHFCFLLHYHAPAIADPDANGYYAQGTRLFTTGKASFKPESDVEFIGMHWLLAEDGTYYSRYSPGFGVIIGLLYSVFGWKAGAMTNLFLASMTLAGLFMILRKENGWGYAFFGMIILGITPLFNSHALMGFAHIAVMCFLTWGMYFLFRWKDTRKMRDAFIAGFLLGVVPVIRYPEALFAIATGTFLLWDVRAQKGNWKQVAVCVAGALVPVGILLVRNQVAFGAFWRTAYDLTNEQTGFGWDWFTEHFTEYVREFTSSGLGMLTGFGLAGLVLMCFDREYRRKGVFHILIIVPTTFLYMSYYWGGRSDSSMRFLLPVFVSILIPGVWFIQQVTAKIKPYKTAVLLSAIGGVHLVWADFGIDSSVYRTTHKKEVYAKITESLIDTVEPGDVIISDQGILQNLDYVRKWKLADLQKIMNSGRSRRSGRWGGGDDRENSPSPRQAAKDEAFRKTFEGLTDFERETIIADQLEDWAGNGNVWFVGDPALLEDMNGICFHRKSFEVVATVKLPEYKEPERRGNDRNRRVQNFFRRMRTPQNNPAGGMQNPQGFPGMNNPMVQRFARRRPGGGMMGPVTMTECVIARWKYGK